MSKVSAVLRFPRSGPGLPVRCWKRHQNLGYAVEPIPVIPKVFVDPAICRQATAEDTIIIRLSWGFDEIRGHSQFASSSRDAPSHAVILTSVFRGLQTLSNGFTDFAKLAKCTVTYA